MKKFLIFLLSIVIASAVTVPLAIVFSNRQNSPLEPGYYENGAMVKSWEQLIEEYPDAFDGDELRCDTSHTSDIRDTSFFQEFTGTFVIDDSITKIGDSAFRNCVNLKEVIIPDSVKSIGYSAFAYCRNLTKIVLPKNLTDLDSMAFDYCGKLSSIVIPDGVTTIGFATFRFCSRLESVVIPESVTSIEDQAFCYCSSLKEIVIPNGVVTIGSNKYNSGGAFESCDSLRKIVIPESVTSISNRDFMIGDGENIISDLITVVIDSPDIAARDGKYTWDDDPSYLVYDEYSDNRVVYVKSGLTVGRYITNRYNKQEVSDKAGYDQYTRNTRK